VALETLELAQRLIALGSVTPVDAGCQKLLGDRLAACGFALEPMRCAEVDNLWARRGNAAPLVCFAGHTDVVPPGPPERWRSDPFRPAIRDGWLYGRGAADMKSSLAAMVVAVERFVARCPDHAGSIAVLLTSDEEGAALDGTVRVVEALRARGEKIDYCVVGEPTSVERLGDTIKNGRRGSLSGTLTVHGRQGHVAYPDRALNPVHAVAPALAELATTAWDRGDEDFPPTTWQVSGFQAGTGATNVIPGTARIQFNFRFGPQSTPVELQRRVERILARHGVDYAIDWSLGARPFHTRRGRLVEVACASILAATGVAAACSTSGGTSDGRFLVELCPELIEFGPVNATIHAIDERVEVASLEPLTRAYQGMLERLLAPAA
jgi:succinyl-diaminopimelate desuccinylase